MPDDNFPRQTNAKRSGVKMSTVIIFNVLLVLLCGSGGMYFWFVNEISSINKQIHEHNDINSALKNSLLEMLELQKNQKKEINDLQEKIVAVAMATDNLDKARIEGTVNAMVSLYSDFDKRTKAFATWAADTEKTSRENTAVFNRNVEIYNKRIASIENNITFLLGETEKHRKAILLMIGR